MGTNASFWGTFSTRPHTLELALSEITPDATDISLNRSLVNWTLIAHRHPSWTSNSSSGNSYSVSIAGNPVGPSSWTYVLSAGNPQVTIDSGQVNVTHAADGTGSMSASGTAYGTSIGTASVSGSMALTPIPRASTPTFEQPSGTPVTSVDAGTTVTIKTNRASSGFTHNITWAFGTQSGTIGTGVGVSTTWVPAVTMLTEIPNNNSGTVVVTTDTYNGATLIGTKVVNLTLTVPSSGTPDFGTVTHSEATTSPNINTLIGAYVKNFTTLSVAITSAVGYQGSTIASYKIELLDPALAVMQTINAVSGTTAVVTTSGTLTLRGTVTDSRGKTHYEDVSITVMAYVVPTITTATAVRSNVGGTVTPTGTYIRVDIVAAVQSLIVGTQKNNLTYTVKTKPFGSGSFSTVDGPTSAGALSYSNYRNVGTYSIANSYTVRLEITDVLGSVSFVDLTVSTGSVVVHYSRTNDAIGVGKYWQQGSIDAQGQIYQNNGKAVIDTDSQATTTARGLQEIATNAESLTMTDTDRSLTPDDLKYVRDQGGFDTRYYTETEVDTKFSTIAQLFILEDQKAANTAGGTFTSGSFVKRDLNTTIVNTITSASISSSVISLPAGTYYVEANCPAFYCHTHKSRLRNTSDSTDLAIGTSEYSPTSLADGVSNRSFIRGYFTLSGTKNIELQHRCTTTRATNGLGTLANLGVVEVYAQLMIRKVA